MKIVTNFSNGNESVTELTLSSEASSLVAQYKNIIREQDAKIQIVNEKFKELQLQNDNLTVSTRRVGVGSVPKKCRKLFNGKLKDTRHFIWQMLVNID